MLLSFGKKGDTVRRGIILEDDSAGHYFVLKDFIPIKPFKKVTENVCGRQNLNLKTVGDTFFANMWSTIKGGIGRRQRKFLMPVPETDLHWLKRYLNFAENFLLKIRVYIKIFYSCICLGLYTSLGFINTKISKSRKLLSISNLPLLFCQPFSFWGKLHMPPFN